MSISYKGTVKWFNEIKGFGFLSLDERDIFVHYQDIKEKGRRALLEGQTVSFEIEITDRGEQAKAVYVLA